jgi:hypothetical protein
MDRADAERVLALVAEISGDQRGRIISERWWLVWIAVGVHMLVGSAVLQALLWQGEGSPAVFGALLVGYAIILFLIIRLIHRRAGGQRTAVETSIWWIWSTQILGTFILTLLEVITRQPLFALAPVHALLAAFAFSVMAMLTDRFFLVHSGLFAAVAVAMALLPGYQFLIYGLVWFVVLTALGLYYRLILVPRPTRRL